MIGVKFTLRRLFLVVMTMMAFAILHHQNRQRPKLFNTLKLHPKNAMNFYIDSNRPKQEPQINDNFAESMQISSVERTDIKNKVFLGDKRKTVASDAHTVHKHGNGSSTDIHFGNVPMDDQQTLKTDTKIILWYEKARYINPSPDLKLLNNCPYRCSFTTNKDYQKVSSALFFSAIVLSGEPPKRYDNQVFVLHNHEPQCAFSKNHAIFKDIWKNSFNWTMWYREDSDIHEPYGLIVKRTDVPEKNFTEIYQKKIKMAAAMVSNCNGQSKRMQYIRKLMTFGVEIDVFGACGKHSCPRGKDGDCRDEMNTKYKFFLSFENSFCPDYISEKFFHPYQGDIVNVARGGGNYSKVAPEGTFINTQDFNTTKDVADYIIRLSKNKDEYINILKRKNKYKSLDEPYPHINKRGKPTYYTYHFEEKPMCDLCRRLWNIENYLKSYSDIKSWFNKSKCLPAKDLD